MNLVLDIGNTRVKAALFEQNSLIELKIYADLKSCLLDKEFILKAKNSILATVVNHIDQEIQLLQRHLPLVVFSHATPIPIKNNYSTPETLGADRILASIGAYCLHPNKNVLVIDAGTCLKYNFTNHTNEFMGGSISPGMEMRFKALNQFTSKLPMVEQNERDYPLIGKNTIQSLSSGVINGLVCEIKGMIEAYQAQFPDLICVLSGGDADFLAKQFKNSIFVRPNLVLEGLNYTLTHQLETN